jgi:S1-C subfamily serine protease
LPIPEPDVAAPLATAAVPPQSRRRRARVPIRQAGGFAAGVIAALVAILLYSAALPGPTRLTSGDVASQVAGILASQTPPPADSEVAYAAIQPSLVEVRTRDHPAARASPEASGGLTGSLGSGVIIDAQGEVLTSLHVVADADVIQLTFADGTVSAAAVSAKDPLHDIAVLQPLEPPATIVPATLGSPNPAIGSEAFVLGNPFGLDGSISAGVVSAVGRSFQPTTGGPTLHGLIQVDAAVNPGNSGGPLVDRRGRVIGIVTALLNPTKEDVFIGIGLAVPINVAGGPAGLPPD